MKQQEGTDASVDAGGNESDNFSEIQIMTTGVRSTRRLILLISIAGACTVRAQGPYKFQILDVQGQTSYNQIQGINEQGMIAGAFLSDSGIKGFVSKADLSNFVQVVGEGTVNTYVTAINSGNQICGNFGNSSLAAFTAVPPFQTLTPLAVPNSTLEAYGIADDGTVTGDLMDSRGTHGFTISRAGALATFNVSGDSDGTQSLAINSAGQTAGRFSAFPSLRGFVRDRSGLIVTFDFPGTTTIFPRGIDNAGNVVGSFDDPSQSGSGQGGTGDAATTHGFWRSADGKTNLFVDVPGSVSTDVLGLNSAGQLVGTFADSTGNHGFIATPTHGSDTAPPTVTISGKSNNATPRLVLYVQDTGSGLASLVVQRNPSVEIDAFTPGTTSPVKITALTGTLVITAQDVAGTKIRFLPIDVASAINGSVKLSATSFHFAPHPAGESGGPANVYIQNTLTAPVALNFSLQDGRYFAITNNTCGASLATGASCQVFFTFSPPGAGDFADALRVQYTGAGSPQAINLTGSGLGDGLSVSPSMFTFAGHPVGEASGPGKIFLHNYGSNPLTILGEAIGGMAPSDFQVVSTTCGASLPAYQTCSYTVTAMPTATGFRNATLQVNSSYAASPQTVTLQTYGK